MSTIRRRTSAFSTLSRASRTFGRDRLVGADSRADFLEDGLQRLGARLLLVDRERLDDLGGRQLLHAGVQSRIGARLGVERPAGLARLRRELLLDAGELLALLVTEGERLEHLLLADLASPRLDHEDGVLRARDDELERRRGELLVRGIGHELAAHQSHPHRADRPGERDPGHRECGRGPDEGEHVGVVLVVRRDHQVDDLQLIAEALREEGAERAVDEAAREGFLLVRPALALEESAGDAPARIGPLAILHREREEIAVAALHRGFGGDNGGQDHGPTALDDDGAVCLLGDLACLDRQRLLVDLGVHRMRHTISILQQR